MDLYQVFYKSRKMPNTVQKSVAWVRAEDEFDAIRIVENNLDISRYVVTGAVYQPDEWRIQPRDITIGFRR